MDVIGILHKNIGIPVIVFYLSVGVVLALHHRKKLKFWSAFIYSMSICLFASSMWEVPMVFFIPKYDLVTVCLYFIPLLLYISLYNVKFVINKRKVFILFCLWILVEGIYLFVFPTIIPNFLSIRSQYDRNIGEFFPFNFIPRTMSLVVLYYVCDPDVSKVRFRIAKNKE